MPRLLPKPSWYTPEIIANPWFTPNPELIQREAETMKREYRVPDVNDQELRILVFDIDNMADFTWPFTTVSLINGAVTRHLPARLRLILNAPEWWNDAGNSIDWYDSLEVHNFRSVKGGKLAVPGAWSALRRSVEWDLCNSAYMTRRAFALDAHPFTARFDAHYYVARKNNPYGLPAGDHPFAFMDGPDKPFPVITPESLWHPKHNPTGWWMPVIADRFNLDEAWKMVCTLQVIVLWFKHGHRGSETAALDPAVMAAAMHHAFLRGGIVAEPLWFFKGVSYRSEAYGAFRYEFKLTNDYESGKVPTMTQLMLGDAKIGLQGFDKIVFKGQARTHCCLSTVEQAVEDLERTGNGDRISDIVFLWDAASDIPGFEESSQIRWDLLRRKKLRVETTDSFDLADLTCTA